MMAIGFKIKGLCLVLIVLLFVFVSGCAGAAAARSLSATGAGLTDSYKAETQTFFQAQDAMNQTALETIASRRQLAAVTENQNRVQRAAWQASNNTAALRIYDSLSAQSDSTILSSNIDLQSLHPIALPSPTTIDPKPFESVTKTLNQMAQKPTLTDQSKFLFNEAKSVSEQYKQSLADGAQSASKAANQTKAPVKASAKP